MYMREEVKSQNIQRQKYDQKKLIFVYVHKVKMRKPKNYRKKKKSAVLILQRKGSP